ncbi:hypothetical protein [Arthrobacter sp. ISL-28]|uniref:hypothetical protein n=1 Tax=Arthrobacter sp. ISL-28 TaxID=2819108 RepID=UPI001BE5FC29|nr:hypothetical protein [Arthrobacter sp. ISL-28]MBT2520033.1 hypothetical protein [Arthrobacter sp. ISL-28]
MITTSEIIDLHSSILANAHTFAIAPAGDRIAERLYLPAEPVSIRSQRIDLPRKVCQAPIQQLRNNGGLPVMSKSVLHCLLPLDKPVDTLVSFARTSSELMKMRAGQSRSGRSSLNQASIRSIPVTASGDL